MRLRFNFKIKPAWILLVTSAVGLIFALGYLTATVVYSRNQSSLGASSATLGADNSPLTLSDFALPREIYQKLADNYLNPQLPDKQKFVEGAAKGIVQALGNKYTYYYTKDEWAQLQQTNSGEFDGIGIKLQPGDTYVTVEVPIQKSPAEQAGIKAADLITKVDGESMAGKSVTDVADKIRGKAGTTVKVTIYRPSKEQTLDFSVVRQPIDTNSIEGKELANGGYDIAISRFTESSYAEFQSQWQNEVTQIKQKNSKYLVLDLRNDTGGWVDAARYVLEEFTDSDKVILREVDRNGNETVTKTTRTGQLRDIPLVVLVNGGSASASEIVAGALQDMGRAKLVGEPTIGKGVEQTIQPTSDGGVLFIVFKKWLTPNGHNLSDGNSLTPDKVLDLSIDDIKAGKDPQLDAAISVVK